MSRHIDRARIASGDLSREDALYLRDRGKLPKGYEIPPGDGDELGEDGPVGPQTAEDMVLRQYAVTTSRTPLDEQDQIHIGDKGGIVGDDDDGDGDLPLTYETEDGWNNDLRRAALSKRGLSVSGGKEDMIARLRRSDSATLNDDDFEAPES